MGVVERKQRQKEQLRASILQAARSIALQEGWQAVTIRKIADEVEYTPPIVYEYFENKEAVLFAVACQGGEILLEKFNQIDATLDAKARLLQYTYAHWAFASENPEIYKLMFGFEGLPSHSEAKAKMATEIRRHVFNTIAEISGTEKEDELAELSFNYFCIIHGFTSMIMLAQSRKKVLPPFKPENVLEKYVNRFIKSIS